MEPERRLTDLIVLIRGGGEIASGVAHRLHRCHFKVCLLELSHPLAVRRWISFCDAIFDGEREVEGVTGKYITAPESIHATWNEGKIPLLVDPESKPTREFLKPHVLVDATLAKKNVGTSIGDAPLVIGLGPGFRAGKEVHVVIETNRGHNLGKVIAEGSAEPDTGIPGVVMGYAKERVLRAMRRGVFHAAKSIGDYVVKGSVVGAVEDDPVIAQIDGVVRGLLRDGTKAEEGMKVGDIDPRGKKEYCFTISEKARAIGGGVSEAILNRFNR